MRLRGSGRNRRLGRFRCILHLGQTQVIFCNAALARADAVTFGRESRVRGFAVQFKVHLANGEISTAHCVLFRDVVGLELGDGNTCLHHLGRFVYAGLHHFCRFAAQVIEFIEQCHKEPSNQFYEIIVHVFVENVK